MSVQHRNAAHIRRQLLVQRSDLIGRRRRIDLDLRRQNEPLSADFAEQATQRQNDDVLAEIDHSASDELVAIDVALARLDAGHYGLCDSCGCEIEAARLETLPYATKCASCSSH